MKYCKLLLGLVFLIFACSDPAIEPEIDPDVEVDLRSGFDYSQFGTYHNELLDEASNVTDFNNTATWQEVAEQLEQFSPSSTSTNLDLSQITVDWTNVQQSIGLSKILIENAESASDTLQDRNRILPREVVFVDTISYLLDNAANKDSESYSSIAQFKSDANGIIDWMNDNFIDTIDNKTYEANYIGKYIAAIEVAKKSYEYWVNAATDSTHIWHYRIQSIATYDAQLTGDSQGAQLRGCGLFCRIWKGIKRVAVDTWSFITGGWSTTTGPSGNDTYTWDLGQASNAAGEASSGVD